MTKVVLLNSLYAPHQIGGAERSVQFLAEALVPRGHEVTVVSTRAQDGTEKAVVNGVNVYYIGLKNLYWPFGQGNPEPLKPLWHMVDTYNPAMARAVAEILDAEQPELIHTNNLTGFSVAVWKTAKVRRIPIVHTLRDYYLLCPRSTMFRKGRNCPSQCLDCQAFAVPRKQQTAQVDVVVGNSAFILNKHLDYGYFSRAQRKVVYNGYKIDNPSPPTPTSTTKLRLGYLGRLAPTKGVDFCLEKLRDHFDGQVELFVAGTGDKAYQAHLVSLWPTAAVHFLGFVRTEQFLSQIDVLLVPSLWHEPLPRTAFEAYAHGRPIVGSNRGGIPELVDEGTTGFVFDPDQPETFRKAVERFVLEPTLAGRMRDACLEKAQSFLPSHITEAYLQVYQAALERVT